MSNGPEHIDAGYAVCTTKVTPPEAVRAYRSKTTKRLEKEKEQKKKKKREKREG